MHTGCSVTVSEGRVHPRRNFFGGKKLEKKFELRKKFQLKKFELKKIELTPPQKLETSRKIGDPPLKRWRPPKKLETPRKIGDPRDQTTPRKIGEPPRDQTTPPVNRILDTRLWKYYLGPTSLRPVIIRSRFQHSEFSEWNEDKAKILLLLQEWEKMLNRCNLSLCLSYFWSHFCFHNNKINASVDV